VLLCIKFHLAFSFSNGFLVFFAKELYTIRGGGLKHYQTNQPDRAIKRCPAGYQLVMEKK